MTCASKLTIGINAARQFDDAQFSVWKYFCVRKNKVHEPMGRDPMTQEKNRQE
jgi:hypothetical protein